MAQQTIENFALAHAAGDVGVGLLMGLVPGGGLMATIGCIAAQGPLVYQPMAHELARIYQAAPDEVTNGIIVDAWKSGAMGDLAAEFAAEFFMEIAGDLAPEIGFGGVLKVIPLMGTLVSAGLDAIIAATLTWRVGTMISMYYQNGEHWVETRRHTYELTKPMTGWSANTAGRVVLDEIPHRCASVREGQLEAVRLLVETLASVCSDRQQVRQALLHKGLPEFLVVEAMSGFMG